MAKNDYFPSIIETMGVHQQARRKAGEIGRAQLPGGVQAAPLPDELERWLVGLRLLERVPFHYLVPDARMLPAESVRFFYLDRTWTDRLVDGAMAAGAAGIFEAGFDQLELSHEQLALANMDAIFDLKG